MKQVTILEENDIATLHKQLDEIHNLLIDLTDKKPKQLIKGRLIDVDKELSNWIPLQKAWDYMNINRGKWYRKYNKIIKHRNNKGEIWVYKPSILEFFEKDNIN